MKRPVPEGLPKNADKGSAKPIGSEILQRKIKGLGPTYLSKVLRFALPSEFGAIDTRIVRVVGMGDPTSKQQNWLSIWRIF